MKKVALIICSVLISSCAAIFDNPYSGLDSNQIKSVSTPDLCSVASDSAYKPSERVAEEVKRRGLNTCSDNEVHCVGLGAAPGTPAYVSCMIEREKMDLQVDMENKRLKQAKEAANQIAESNRKSHSSSHFER